ncbi:hypothetical protein KKG24_01150 [Patescibacteria group bacterium]|nr:hypothetical protein [Patescibacteria group bacterium]
MTNHQSKIDFKKKFETVKSFISSLIQESTLVWNKLNDEKCIRTLAILSFAKIEVFSCYWSLYNGNSEKKNKEKMITWINKFLLLNKNKVLSDFPHYKKISSDDLYQLRCNLMHFFSCTYKTIGISNGDERTLEKCFTDSGVFISNMSFNLLIYEGAKIMLEILLDETNKTENHKKGIERIYEKIKNEGGLQLNI